MTGCEFLSKCVFFNDLMKDMPAGSRVFKRDYCLSDFCNCARYKVATSIGTDNVPSDMFPNQLEDAEQLIKKKTDD